MIAPIVSHEAAKGEPTNTSNARLACEKTDNGKNSHYVSFVPYLPVSYDMP
jgi:hypothetical protein